MDDDDVLRIKMVPVYEIDYRFSGGVDKCLGTGKDYRFILDLPGAHAGLPLFFVKDDIVVQGKLIKTNKAYIVPVM